MADIVNLKEYLRRVFNDLKSYTESLSPEELKAFHVKCHTLFRNGEGDYSDRYLIAYYVMEYARAYGFQFSRAYMDIFARIPEEQKKVSSVSFGCGTGIDYWGMSYAARMLMKKDNMMIDYTGIDPADWSYKISDAPDMPERDSVNYNRLSLGEGRADTRCMDFGEYLDIMKANDDMELPDIYFFPHSLKEVCLHTVPDGGNEQYRYCNYWSMAKFAEIIEKRLKDKPLYIAVTYRRKPQGLEHSHAYDTRYATYLTECLKQRGMGVSQLKPANLSAPIYKDMDLIDDVETNAKYYFRYKGCHSYTGKKCKEGEKIELWQMGNDKYGTFDKLFYGKDSTPRITDGETWMKVVGRDVYSMDNVSNMCYQVFKVTRRERRTADLRRIQVVRNECVDMLLEVLDSFKFPIEYDNLPIETFIYNIFRHLDELGVTEKITKRLIIRLDVIMFWLVRDGLLAEDDSDGEFPYKETEFGKKMGVFIFTDLNGAKSVGLDVFAQQSIIANMLTGRYLKANRDGKENQ